MNFSHESKVLLALGRIFKNCSINKDKFYFHLLSFVYIFKINNFPFNNQHEQNHYFALIDSLALKKKQENSMSSVHT